MDVCSDLSSLHSTPRPGFKEVAYGLGRPSRSPNTSSKVESGIWALERAGLLEIPTRGLQATGGDTSHPRVLDALMRDVATPSTNPSTVSLFLDRHHRTPRQILLWTICLYIVYSSHLWYTPILATAPRAVSDHKGSDAGRWAGDRDLSFGITHLGIIRRRFFALIPTWYCPGRLTTPYTPVS